MRASQFALPRLIVLSTIVHVGIGLATLVTWAATGSFGAVEFYFDYPGAFFFVACAALEVSLSVSIVSHFESDELLRPAWACLTAAAVCRYIGMFLSQVWKGPWYDTGKILGGPVQFFVLLIGLSLVLRTYRQLGVRPPLRRWDYVLLLFVGTGTLTQMAIWLQTMDRGFTSKELINWLTDPVLDVLLLLAILLRRAALQMGGGLIAKCWSSYILGVFLIWAGDWTIMAVNYGVIPWPYFSITWFIWFPAMAAFVLGPAYQYVALQRVAKLEMREKGSDLPGAPVPR